MFQRHEFTFILTLITQIMLHPVICSAKHNIHAYNSYCLTDPPPHPKINEHSRPEDTIYQPQWCINTVRFQPVPVEKDQFYFQRERLFTLANSSNDSVSKFENVTDFHYPNITYTKHRMRTEKKKNPCLSRKEVSGVQKTFFCCFLRPTRTPKKEQSGQRRLITVPFDTTQPQSLKLMDLR